MMRRAAFGVGSAYSVISPASVMRPILLPDAFSPNHNAVAPTVIANGVASRRMSNSVNAAVTVSRRPDLGAPLSQNQRAVRPSAYRAGIGSSGILCCAVVGRRYPSNKIGRITLAGEITEYRAADAEGRPDGINARADGNVWFSETDAGQIGRITPAGAITEFRDGITPGAKPFVDRGARRRALVQRGAGNRVGRITIDGQVTEFPIPSHDSQPRAMRGASRRQHLVVQTSTNALGRVDKDGTMREFLVPTPNASLRRRDGRRRRDLWFTEKPPPDRPHDGGRATLLGEYAIPTPASGARCIAPLKDGRAVLHAVRCRADRRGDPG